MMNQISFAKLDAGMDMPHLLDIQTRAFEALLQLDAASIEREDIGLERVFKDLFPITDVHENFSLEFVRYSLGEPKYSVAECIERDMTYSAPLKATLQLVIFEDAGSDMISTIEAALIKLNRPLWNTAVDGFGNHDPGSGRYEQAKSEWDVIHEGRAWANKCKGTHAERAIIISKIERHLKKLGQVE